MSETTEITEAVETVDRAGDSTDETQKPTETVDFWKSKAREWEKRSKANAEASERLAEIEESQKSEADKATERLADAERRASEAEARATRRDIAIEHKLSTEDAALLDTITDEDTMRALAARLASVAADSKHGNYVPREGNNPPAKPDERRAFADFLTGNAH